MSTLSESSANATILSGWNAAQSSFTLDNTALTAIGLASFISPYWSNGIALTGATSPVVDSVGTGITVTGNASFCRPGTTTPYTFAATLCFDTTSGTSATVTIVLTASGSSWWQTLFPELSQTFVADLSLSSSAPSVIVLASVATSVNVNGSNIPVTPGMTLAAAVDILGSFPDLSSLLANLTGTPYFVGAFDANATATTYAFTLTNNNVIPTPWVNFTLPFQLSILVSVQPSTCFGGLQVSVTPTVGAQGPVALSAVYVPQLGTVTLTMNGTTPGGAISLSDLVSLLPATVTNAIPDQIPTTVFSAIDSASKLFQLNGVSVTISLAPPSIQQLFCGLGIANSAGTQYTTPLVSFPDGDATLNDVTVNVTVVEPLSSQFALDATLSADATLFSTAFSVTASTDQGVNLQTQSNISIPFASAISSYTNLSPSSIPDWTITNLQLGLMPSPLTLSMGGSLAPWSLTIGQWVFNFGALILSGSVSDATTRAKSTSLKTTPNGVTASGVSVTGDLTTSVSVLDGSTAIGSASLAIAISDQWQGTFTLDNLQLSTLFTALSGTTLPFVSDVTIPSLSVTTGSNNYLAFDIALGPLTIGGTTFLSITSATATFVYQDGVISTSLVLEGSAAGKWLTVDQFSITLSYDSSQATWVSTDTVKGSIFGESLDLAVKFSYVNGNEYLNLLYAGNVLALSISDLSFAVNQLSLTLQNNADGVSLAFSNTFAISLATLDTVQGSLQLDIDNQTDSLQFTFTKGTTFSFSVCNIGGYNIGLSVGLEQLGLTYASDAWSLTETTGFAVTGFPQFLYHNNILIEPTDATPLPYQIQFVANDSGVTVTLAELVNIPSFDLSLNIGGVPISLPAWKGAAIGILNVQATLNATPGVSFELAITLPQSLNDIFLGAAAPFSQTPFSMTFGIGSVNGATGINFSVDSIPFLTNFVKSVQTPQGPGWSIDLGDFGALTIAEPSFGLNADTMSFQSSGWITGLETLQIPFKPLRSLLKQTPVPSLADVIPDASLPLLGITNVKFVNGNYIDAQGIVTYFSAPPWNSFIPSCVLSKFADALSALKLPISDLPARMLNYLQPTFPNTVGWNIEIGSSASLTIDLQIGDQTVPRAQREALRIMLPALIGPPSILGFTIYGFSIGPVLGGALFELTLDCDIDQFDLLDIAAADLLHAADSSIPLPTASELVRTITIDSLYTIVIYEDGGIPIPLPLFFNDLGLDYYGAEGVGAHGHVSFSMPQVGLGTIVGVVGNLYDFCKNVINDPTYPFPTNPDPFGSADPTFALNNWYLDIPAYLGGGIAGVKGNVVTLPVFDDFVKIFNAVRTIDFLGIIAELPAKVTSGSVNFSYSSIHVAGNWAITAGTQPRSLNVQLSGDCTDGDLAGLQGAFTMLANSASGFASTISFSGNLTPFSLAAGGSVVIDPKASPQFSIQANEQLKLVGTTVISGTGSATYAPDNFSLNATFSLFDIINSASATVVITGGYGYSFVGSISAGGMSVFPMANVTVNAQSSGSGSGLDLTVNGRFGWSDWSNDPAVTTSLVVSAYSDTAFQIAGNVNSSLLGGYLCIYVSQGSMNLTFNAHSVQGGSGQFVAMSATFSDALNNINGSFTATVVSYTVFEATATNHGNANDAIALDGTFYLVPKGTGVPGWASNLAAISASGSIRQSYVGFGNSVYFEFGHGDSLFPGWVGITLNVNVSPDGFSCSGSGTWHTPSILPNVSISASGTFDEGPSLALAVTGTLDKVSVGFTITFDSSGISVGHLVFPFHF